MSFAEQTPQNYRLPKIAPDMTGLMKILAEHDPELRDNPAAVEAMARFPYRYGEYLILASAPGTYSAIYDYFAQLVGLMLGKGRDVKFYEAYALTLDPETKARPDWRRWCVMYAWMQVHHLPGGEYTRALLMVDQAVYPLSVEQMLMADQPDSGIWSDDERLALRFVKAAFTYEMTDELCEEAVTAWGAEWTITALAYLNMYFLLHMLHETFGNKLLTGVDWSKPLAAQVLTGEAL